MEVELVQQLVRRHNEAAVALRHVTELISTAIAVMCAAHGLEGDWRIAEDMQALVRVESQMHEGSARVTLRGPEGGTNGD
ncbi:MAG: hypothetical protein N2045_14095 [Fimbriimonadales bacterium]|nr:hypothetical protein [Fimbriimonadales bacterium]